MFTFWHFFPFLAQSFCGFALESSIWVWAQLQKSQIAELQWFYLAKLGLLIGSVNQLEFAVIFYIIGWSSGVEMETLIEQQRRAHEERERIVDTMVKEFL